MNASTPSATTNCSSAIKVSLDLFWLRDESLEGADVLAASIVEGLQTALEQFMAISEDLGNGMSVDD